MKLKLRDMEPENGRVVEKDYLDLLDISIKVGKEEDKKLFQWVNKDADDSFEATLNSHPLINSTSVGQSSRPSVVGTSTSRYDGSRCGMMEDEDHGFRKAGPSIKVIGKTCKEREKTMAPPFNEHSMDEEYGMPSHSPSAQMTCDSYHVLYQIQGEFDTSTWVNSEYPIYVEAVGKTQEIYAWHL
ncbi:hypothetical protein CK203_104184 [Vitis vinifera]|uniref:Uncharacterized protein n=1 Tax=Vitis vinifera TaxID=29760 RepID=A0A438CUN3_VITVI|nr:hypothetical protein CK203_104184 [Vitis vinifera]